MKLDDVPQDRSSTYGGHRKLVYAVDERGNYCSTQSDGWEPEAFSTRLAVAELLEREAMAEQEWREGRVSPLKFLMCRSRLDEAALAQATGLWRWRVRRHFRPEVFRRLPRRVLQRYCEVLAVPVDTLCALQREAQP